MNDASRVARGRRCPIEVRRGVFLVGLPAGLLLCLCCALVARAEPNSDPYRLGFTRSIFSNRNENDMLAALKGWSHAIVTERGMDVDPRMDIYESVEQAEDAVRDKRVDALTLSLAEYSAFPSRLLSGPFFRNENHGSTHVTFVLVGRTGGGVSRLGGLGGAKLVVHDSPDARLAIDWLEAELEASGLASLGDLVTDMDRNSKLSSTVLSVFFGKNDACLVSREGFETMAELNPQVSQQLTVVAVSPAVIPSLFCFRSDLAETKKARFFTEVLNLGETVTGQQVLRVFKADRMSEVTAVEMDRSLALMRRWQVPVTPRSGPTVGGPES